MSESAADGMYELSQSKKYDSFVDILTDAGGVVDARQLDTLIKIDFFSQFGNQRELIMINDIFTRLKRGEAKKIKRELVDGTRLESIVKRHATWLNKDGSESKSYTLTNVHAILEECEQAVKAAGVKDLSILIKARNFKDIMGYAGYISGEELDRNKLLITGVYPVHRKKDNVLFGYSVLTQSIGNGKQSRMTVFKTRYDKEPIKEGDIIVCKRWERDGKYFQLREYEHLIV